MDTLVLQNEPALRFGAFAGAMLAMMVWELAAPRRRLAVPRLVRWSNNLALVALDTAVLRLAFPLLAVGMAQVALERGWGLFNLLDWPYWLEFALALLVFDFVIYGQHVLFHKVPLFWRFHRMHHADLDFDTTTGIRFHPFEAIVSMGVKLTLVVLIGPSVLAVLVFEVVLNATSLFNHGNVSLGRADPILRRLIVTPDMHRVHHSVVREEHDSNFGFNLSFWDRLCGTYRAQPAAGQDGMTIGLDLYRSPRELWLDRMLLQPFR